MVTRTDYDELQVGAAHSIVIELMRLLGEYHSNIVLIGGWVPQFLFQNLTEKHTGSLDVDIALNHRNISEEGYKTISELLLSRDYRQGKQPFIFHKVVNVSGQDIDVQVDLLSGEYEGTGKHHRHQKIQDVHARKVRGCDLAFDDPIEMTIEGNLPSGAKDKVKIRVASIVSFIVMKAIVLDDRLKEKDSYDIYYCLKNYPGGLDQLIELFKPHMENGLVIEGLQKLEKNFKSVEHTGPKFVADFEEIEDGEERNMFERDAFERVQHLLKGLEMI